MPTAQQWRHILSQLCLLLTRSRTVAKPCPPAGHICSMPAGLLPTQRCKHSTCMCCQHVHASYRRCNGHVMLQLACAAGDLQLTASHLRWHIQHVQADPPLPIYVWVVHWSLKLNFGWLKGVPAACGRPTACELQKAGCWKSMLAGTLLLSSATSNLLTPMNPSS